MRLLLAAVKLFVKIFYLFDGDVSYDWKGRGNEIEFSAKESFLKKAYKSDAMDKVQAYKWFSCLNDADIKIYDKLCSGHPYTSKTDKHVKKFKNL